MKRCDVYDVLHVANWGAFAIAVFRPIPTSVELAFKLYETGSATSNGCHGHLSRELMAERVEAMESLHAAGYKWREIGQYLGVKYPECYYVRWKKKYGDKGRVKK